MNQSGHRGILASFDQQTDTENTTIAHGSVTLLETPQGDGGSAAGLLRGDADVFAEAIVEADTSGSRASPRICATRSTA